tara:strand:- start:13704 stop:13985 length:282 start_codon:yes stop_codon:yes gene_type:complete
MKLECDTFYFYPNGEYRDSHKWNGEFSRFNSNPVPVSTAIRIFGTRKQIDEAFEKYCEETGLNIDECYDFEDKETLKRYRQYYKNKALIINIR